VQALEYAEELVDVFHIETDTVIPDIINRFLLFLSAAELDYGPGPSPGEFNGVGQQVLQDLVQHGIVAVGLGNRAGFEFDAPPFFCGFEFAENGSGQNGFIIDFWERCLT